jgi:hypothetical protein
MTLNFQLSASRQWRSPVKVHIVTRFFHRTVHTIRSRFEKGFHSRHSRKHDMAGGQSITDTTGHTLLYMQHMRNHEKSQLKVSSTHLPLPENEEVLTAGLL